MDKRYEISLQQRATQRIQHERQLTAIESAQVRKIREMIQHLVLARVYFEQDDRFGYDRCLELASALATSIKRDIDELFRVYRNELAGDDS